MEERWYVIQTLTGKEQQLKTMIDTAMPREIFRESRLFYYEEKRRYLGGWHIEKKMLFPGYVFILTGSVYEMRDYVRHLPQFARVLGRDSEAVPLSDDEADVLLKITGGSDVVRMSYGVKEGDEVTVTGGALVGMECRIVKIDRHKRKALIELDFLGEKRQVQVGLEIIKTINA